MKSRVELVSDVLLVQVPGMTQWVPFRDVFKVDGKLIRDREDRLLDLFLDGSEDAVEQALSITKESARFNIGPVDRTINVPTLALFFVSDQNRSRFEFKEQGRETIDGLSAWKLEYRERGRPTLVRTHRGENLPAAGAFWLDPTTGAVLQTELRTSGFGVRSKVVVTYTFEPTLGLRVPVEMVERYQVQGGMRRTEGAWTRLVATGDTVVIDAKATYDRFRRFSVDVDERLLKFIR
jgi:hypothetical protein